MFEYIFESSPQGWLFGGIVLGVCLQSSMWLLYKYFGVKSGKNAFTQKGFIEYFIMGFMIILIGYIVEKLFRFLFF